MNKKGIGIMRTEINPSVELPHPKPNLSYNGAPASGKKAPKRDLRIVAAARAEAEYSVNASTRYTCIVIWLQVRIKSLFTATLTGWFSLPRTC